MTQAPLAAAYRMRVESLLALVDAYDDEVALFADTIATRLRDHPASHALQTIPGVGPTLAAVFVAEGDVHRFAGPGSWPAGPG